MSLARFLRTTSRKFSQAFFEDLGIDLGTANTLVYVRGRGIVVNEPTVVALNRKTGAVIAVGSEARRMIGKAPAHIAVVRPVLAGAVSDFEVTEQILRYLMARARRGGRFAYRRPRVVIAVSAGASEVERRAAIEAAKNAGAGEVFLVEESLAGALGMRLPAQEAEGILTVDIGGGTAEISVLSLGSVVGARTLKIAGDRFNQDIVDFALDHHQVFLGERSAEEIKIAIGSAKPLGEPIRFIMRGRNAVNGLPREVSIGDEEVRRALAASVMVVAQTLKAVIEETPPELVADITGRGIFMLGGGSLLRGLEEVLAEEAGVAVHRAEEPLTAVARGTGIILEDFERYQDLLKRE
jgi:rod shape-determining protein MreB